MRTDELLSVLAIVLGAVGTYLLLPHGHGRLKPRAAHLVGGALVAVSILLLASFWTRPGPFLESAFFYAFALAAVAGGVLMITSRDPVHSALWFAAVVLATTGLFLLSGAQFLAAGTVIVYAGAIIVTFLFVIMLAQAEGQAPYDRAARAPARSTISCFLLLWGLLYALTHARQPDASLGVIGPPEARLVPASVRADARDRRGRIPAADVARVAALERAVRRETSRVQGPGAPHVAGLGAALYADQLFAVEVAGALLFIALVGAAAIATPKPPVRPAGPAMPGPLEPSTLRGD
jgi:NADH-quinone oxidoreductase subunit J